MGRTAIKIEASQRDGTENHFSVDAVRDHYDRLSVFYRALWGEHIHHGYWEDGESHDRAQVKFVERLAARARIPRGSSVLDVGCGIGGPAVWLARNLDCSVLGLTISPFVETFPVIRRAYQEGAMAYGMFTARKA